MQIPSLLFLLNSFLIFPLCSHHIYLSCSHSFAPKSAVLICVCMCVMHCSVDLCYHGLFLIYLLSRWASLTVSTSAFFIEAQPAQRVGDLLCGWEAVACKAHSGPRAVGFSPPLNLCNFSVCSLHFSFFLPFSLGSCGGGKTYGAVYLFWFGVGSRMSLAGFHTSMTVAWIARDYHDIMFTHVPA